LLTAVIFCSCGVVAWLLSRIILVVVCCLLLRSFAAAAVGLFYSFCCGRWIVVAASPMAVGLFYSFDCGVAAAAVDD